jgi:acyl CoA:acetate/3-ketoacid CoA transferase
MIINMLNIDGGTVNQPAKESKEQFVEYFLISGEKKCCSTKIWIRKYKKFIKTIPQNSFSLKSVVAAGHKIMYITERCLFPGTAEGLFLTEIAPGIDLRTKILDQMGFMPIIPKGGPKLMEAGIFQENRGSLKAIPEAKQNGLDKSAAQDYQQ